MDDMQQLLTKQQLAALLQVSQRTVDRWFSENRLPSDLKLKISGTARYRLEIAKQWIAASSGSNSPRCPTMADDRIWTTCPDCGSDFCQDDTGTWWCQNCGTLDVPALPHPNPLNEDF